MIAHVEIPISTIFRWGAGWRTIFSELY